MGLISGLILVGLVYHIVVERFPLLRNHEDKIIVVIFVSMLISNIFAQMGKETLHRFRILYMISLPAVLIGLLGLLPIAIILLFIFALPILFLVLVFLPFLGIYYLVLGHLKVVGWSSTAQPEKVLGWIGFGMVTLGGLIGIIALVSK